MISFGDSEFWFNLRAAAVIAHPSGDGRFLVQGTPHDSVCALPGGRCDRSEAAADALAREMREELGEAAEVGRLLFVAENFFVYDEQAHHALELFFHVTFAEDSPVYKKTDVWQGVEEGVPLLFWWKRPDEVERLPLVPIFLRKTLLSPLPQTPLHIVNREQTPRR